MERDKDLEGIRQVRDLIDKAKSALKAIEDYDQKKIDNLTKVICDACIKNSEMLAKMAQEETGFGIWQDKVIKNLLGSKMVYENMVNMKTIGILSEDLEKGIIEVAVPVGIIAALIPSTNPTSTTMYKALISIKAGNAVIISPHPGALRCITETVKIIREAIKSAGAPEDLVQCVTIPVPEAVDHLMKHKDTGLILATGGEAMVRAAYSSGTPALGVGPGNGPAFIEKTADVKNAVKRIMDSKTFDNGTICASEQSIVVERVMKDKVIEEFRNQGAHFLSDTDSQKLGKFILRSNGTMNPQIVGKSVEYICKLAGINAPKQARVLISMEDNVSKNNPYAREKLCPILAFYIEETWEDACNRCMEILGNEGAGHTMTIHTEDKEIVKAFGLKKPVSRLLVNTAAALGGVGATTRLVPALTLGCGSVGGSATSDNVDSRNLFNIRRVAYGKCELSDLRNEKHEKNQIASAKVEDITAVDIEKITKEVLKNILQQTRG